MTGRQPLTTLRTIVQTGAIPAKPVKASATVANAAAVAQPAGYVAGTTVIGPTTAGVNGANQTAASMTIDSNPWPTAPPPGTYSGNLDGWIAQAGQILEANGYPASQWNPADVALIAQYESGGSPYAINTTDSNAVAGHPSISVMQTIRGTFNAHALPGHYDIFNPVDNIIAAVRYAQDQYGGLENVPGVISVHNGGPYQPY